MFDCVASQPIFNTKQEIFGYELLYRAGQNSVGYDATDGSSATKNVLMTAFTDIGIEEITGGRKAFVNFTEELIACELPMILSNNILVAELLEDIPPTPEVLAVCRKMKQKGYLMALDDYIYSEETEPLLEIADIVKVDFIKCDREEIRAMLKKILRRGRRKILLAEKVETYEDLEFARELGFTLFQGYFFCRPTITQAKYVDTVQSTKLQLLRYVSDPDVSFVDLANVIKRDVVLSYRLLRIVNSAYYGLNYSVTGILHALTILGLDDIRKWVCMILLGQLKTDKPNELIRTALVRGVFMEKLAVLLRKRKERDQFFLLGLFSLSDAIMDASMESIMLETHLSETISEPLITGRGDRAQLLQIVVCMERARWDEAIEIGGHFGIPQEKINQFYIDALVSANKLLS